MANGDNFSGPKTVSFLEGFGKSEEKQIEIFHEEKYCHRIDREWSQMIDLVALITVICGML
jgi:hypothetical protein